MTVFQHWGVGGGLTAGDGLAAMETIGRSTFFFICLFQSTKHNNMFGPLVWANCLG